MKKYFIAIAIILAWACPRPCFAGVWQGPGAPLTNLSTPTNTGSWTFTSTTTFLSTVTAQAVIIGSPAILPSNILSNMPLGVYSNVNQFMQMNVQNFSSGSLASADIIVTNDTGSDNGNYADFGINSSGFSTNTFAIAQQGDAYLYNASSAIAIGSGALGKQSQIRLFTGGYLPSNERVHVDSNGLVGIGISTPTTLLHVAGGITATSVTFSNATDGQIRIQSNAGLELLTSTVPAGNISTMTVTFSSMPYLYVVIYASNTAGSAGGDIFIRFNSRQGISGSTAPVYALTRTTSAPSGIPLLSVSSISAVGLSIFGDNVSTTALRGIALTVMGNDISFPKIGTFDAVAVSTASDTASFTVSKGGWAWAFPGTQITEINVYQRPTNIPTSNGSTFAIGSRIQVYGRRD